AGAKAYLKSPLRHLGADAPALRAAAARWDQQAPALSAPALLSMAAQAFDTGLWEDRLLAGLTLERRRRVFGPSELPGLAVLCARSETWAFVDLLAVKVIGPALWTAAEPAAALEPLVVDPSVWVRRAALLAPLDRLRAGQGELGLFVGVAERLIGDPSFWIQKAIGWVLRDCARKRPAAVAAAVEQLGPRLRGLARREAERGLSRAAAKAGGEATAQ
ncbi:MAG: DNA alkylation repair protein, partial [Deltaproteobacteria bacterium]|nr:DNA alkylation repair protein [Deltaproteobacteria bacterium]